MRHKPWAVRHMARLWIPLIGALLLAARAEMGTAGGDTAAATPTGPSTTPTSVRTMAVNASGTPASTTPSPTLTATAGATTAAPFEDQPQALDETTGVTYNENAGGGGGKNIVTVLNRTHGRLSVRANVQLNRVPGPLVEPVNLALAYASCTDCQTLAVALQINLISRTANKVTPENAAVAVNYACTRCVTVARALQYVHSVDDPTQVPPEASKLIAEMERELKAIHAEPDITLAEAEGRINAVTARFQELTPSLDDQRNETSETTSPNATPLPTAQAGTPLPTMTGAPTATWAPTTMVAPTVSDVQPTATATPSPVQAPEVTALPTATSAP